MSSYIRLRSRVIETTQILLSLRVLIVIRRPVYAMIDGDVLDRAKAAAITIY